MKITVASLSRAKRYYLMTSCIVPRPIAWVGTVNEDGTHNLAPYSYFNAFSSTPPIVGVGFGHHRDKTDKDSLRNIRRTGELTISVASDDLVEKLQATSDDLPYGQDEFVHAGLTPVEGETVAAPYVAEAPISFECTLRDLIPLGDAGSTLMLADVQLIQVADQLLNERGIVDPYRFKALCRLSSGYFAKLGDIIKLP